MTPSSDTNSVTMILPIRVDSPASTGIIRLRQGLCLGGKRQRLTAGEGRGGRLPEPPGEGSGQVRRIEVAGLVHGVEDRRALPQETRRISGPLDLPPGRGGDPGRTQGLPLGGTQGERFPPLPRRDLAAVTHRTTSRSNQP